MLVPEHIVEAMSYLLGELREHLDVLGITYMSADVHGKF